MHKVASAIASASPKPNKMEQPWQVTVLQCVTATSINLYQGSVFHARHVHRSKITMNPKVAPASRHLNDIRLEQPKGWYSKSECWIALRSGQREAQQTLRPDRTLIGGTTRKLMEATEQKTSIEALLWDLRKAPAVVHVERVDLTFTQHLFCAEPSAWSLDTKKKGRLWHADTIQICYGHANMIHIMIHTLLYMIHIHLWFYSSRLNIFSASPHWPGSLRYCPVALLHLLCCKAPNQSALDSLDMPNVPEMSTSGVACTSFFFLTWCNQDPEAAVFVNLISLIYSNLALLKQKRRIMRT